MAVGLQDQLGVEHVPDSRLLLLDRLVELVERQVLRLERAELPLHVGQLGPALRR